jgi:hypothetical protein
MKPNKKNIKKWVDALRSGKFKQTKGMLKNRKGEYCCLGVACEISDKIDGWEDSLAPFYEIGAAVFPKRFKGALYLPTSVMEWLGIDQSNPTLLKRKVDNTAANLNDRGVSFKRIATYIERKYLKD